MSSIAEIKWDVDLFPNPAQDQIRIVTRNESEWLKVKIKDLCGRVVFESNFGSKQFITTFNLSLINGAYFIEIINFRNESTTKKLLIAR
ncbi:MAG: T9SS type A sorting domain-containing protein [bacterium]|nr:T9SS type A sorting domain-containing protein [bacterium]